VAGKGRTAAIELAIEDARRAIAGYEDRLAVAGSNAPTASVLSGSPDAVEEMLVQLRAKGVFCRELHVDVAAHSPQMDPLVPELEAQLAGMLPRAGNVSIYSTVVAGLIGGERLDRRYWGRNLREPFQFAATIERMTTDGYARFLEIGPHPVLAHAMERTLRHLGRTGTVLPSLHRERTDRDVMLLSLGALFAAGHSVNWPPLEDPLATIGAEDPPTVERTLTVHQRVRLLVAATLLLNLGDLPDDVPLVDMGMDSVTGLSLLAKIAESFGVQIQTNELLLLATVSGLTRRLEGGAEVSAAEAVKIPIRTTADPRVEMVMFPGAGGTALMLAPWASAHLVGEANVSAMHAPGHDRDRRPPIRRMGELVERFVEALVPVEHPLVLVGYSIGGVVAYAVAHALERRGVPPHAVVISHTLPPPIWRDSRFSRDPRLEEIFGRLYEAGGIDAQSRVSFLETARADFELAESFELPSTKLSALTFIISGAADELAPAQQLLGWDALCARPFHYSAKGGHFDFLEHPSNHDLLRSIYARACGTADPQSVRASAARLRVGRTP
jgi:surfactin synthase thioesterase subunit/acyl carrier protein